MTDMSNGESSAAHEPITWQPCPTGFDSQASYPVSKARFHADHVGAVCSEIVRLFAFGFDGDVVTIGMSCKFDETGDEPFDSSVSDLIVCRLERRKIGE